MTKQELEELFDHAVTPGVQAAQDYLAARRERDQAQSTLDAACAPWRPQKTSCAASWLRPASPPWWSQTRRETCW